MPLLLTALLVAAQTSAAPCASGAAGTTAAAANAASLETLLWAPYRRDEQGWRIYAPKIATEIATGCAAGTAGFAAALAVWQGRHRLPASGIFDPPTFAAMKATWQAARPFARIDPKLACPPPPPPGALAWTLPAEGYGGKLVQLRPGALAAYRAMIAAARQDPAVAAERRSLTIFSGFRDPISDAVRCSIEGNCDGTVRASCSAHRTGLAVDMWVGQAKGFGPDSTADANRVAMIQSPAYRWLLKNARRFGFVNYVFEPWHWEWTGEPI